MGRSCLALVDAVAAAVVNAVSILRPCRHCSGRRPRTGSSSRRRRGSYAGPSGAASAVAAAAVAGEDEVAAVAVDAGEVAAAARVAGFDTAGGSAPSSLVGACTAAPAGQVIYSYMLEMIFIKSNHCFCKCLPPTCVKWHSDNLSIEPKNI